MAKKNHSHSFKYMNYKEEVKMRMQRYHEYPDMITLFLNAFKIYEKEFRNAVKAINNMLRSYTLPIFNEEGTFTNVSSISLMQIEDIARQMNSCGFAFLEGGISHGEQKFFEFLPLRYQPYLDELFESAFHRELELFQYHINDFLEGSHLNMDEINAIDLGDLDVTLSHAEKIAQGVYIPAFEMVRREYILYAASKIREYNPHRIFHRLYDLGNEDKLKIMDYVRYMIQGDQFITAGEIEFVDKVIKKLRLKDFDATEYKYQLMQEMDIAQLQPFSENLPEAIRRQILGLIIECAYADKMLTSDEDARIMEISKVILMQ